MLLFLHEKIYINAYHIILGFGQQTAYSPNGLKWHLWDERQELLPPGPQVTRSWLSMKRRGSPNGQGFSNFGRQSGTGGQGSEIQFSCIILHSSPLSQVMSSHGDCLHWHMGHPEVSSWFPNSHWREHRFKGQTDGPSQWRVNMQCWI